MGWGLPGICIDTLLQKEKGKEKEKKTREEKRKEEKDGGGRGRKRRERGKGEGGEGEGGGEEKREKDQGQSKCCASGSREIRRSSVADLKKRGGDIKLRDVGNLWQLEKMGKWIPPWCSFGSQLTP